MTIDTPNTADRTNPPPATRSRLPPYSQVVIDSLPRVWFLGIDGRIIGMADDLGDLINNEFANPILAPARSGLLATEDPWLRRRLIARRCNLVIIEIDPATPPLPGRGPSATSRVQKPADQPVTRALVRIGHWRRDFGDMRPFFKFNGLTKPEIGVEVVNLRLKTMSRLRGTDYLFGAPYEGDLPIDELVARWSRWGEPSLETPAPVTERPLRLPHSTAVSGQGTHWSAIEAVWRVLPPLPCPNCHVNTIVAAIETRRGRRCRLRVLCQAVCPKCRRLHETPLDHRRMEVNQRSRPP